MPPMTVWKMVGRAAGTALGLALTSADIVGLMRGVLDLTVAYAKDRKQYGVAIGSFQAVQHLLAEARCLIEGAFSAAFGGLRASRLTYRCTLQVTQGEKMLVIRLRRR